MRSGPTFITVAIVVVVEAVGVIDGVALLDERHAVKAVKQTLFTVTRFVTHTVSEQVVAVDALQD